MTISFDGYKIPESRMSRSGALICWLLIFALGACCKSGATTPKTAYSIQSSKPIECNVPQEPSPVRIVPYHNDRFIIISQPDWALMMGYVYGLQNWVRIAGPCLKGSGSDAPVGTGVFERTQRNP